VKKPVQFSRLSELNPEHEKPEFSGIATRQIGPKRRAGQLPAGVKLVSNK